MDPKKRCDRCLINSEFCFCGKTKKVEFNSQVHIILNKAELRFSSNTANLSANTSPQCHLHIRGIKGKPLDFSFLDFKNYYPLYLYPSEDATALTKEYAEKLDRPVQLVVPDGTWTQTSKFFKKHTGLHSIPRVKINNPPCSLYELRKQVFGNGLCTQEAIAYALGVLEGSEIQEIFLENLRTMVNAHQNARKRPNYKLRYFYSLKNKGIL